MMPRQWPHRTGIFCTDVDAMLSCLTAETRIVYLANPDNPSGAMLPGTELRRLHAGLPRDVLLVIDGAYSEYVTDPAYENGEALVREHGNVVLTRSFSKIYGLAGARVGWAYGSPHVIDTITRIGLTFPLATPSLHAAIAALKDREHRDYVRRETALLRDEATQKLSEAGIHVYPGHGFYPDGNGRPQKSCAQDGYGFTGRGYFTAAFCIARI